MAAVLGIVEGHGGGIMIQSEPGKGTTAKVIFPAQAPAGKIDTAETGGRLSPGTPGLRPEYASNTVLVVDDDEMVLDLCAAMMEQLGFKVLRASDGNKALDVFRRHAEEISLTILDLTMPGMDGVAAFHELRRIRGDAKVIISSGYSEQEVSRRFQRDEPAGFIKKPFEFSNLYKKISEVFEKG